MSNIKDIEGKKRKTDNLVAGGSSLKRLCPLIAPPLTIVNCVWPFVIIARYPQQQLPISRGQVFWINRHFLFNSPRELSHKGFTKWETHDTSTRQYLSNSLNEIFPGDLITLIISYVKPLRPQIKKDRNETLALSRREKACIRGFAKMDTLSIVCVVLSTSYSLNRHTRYGCFVYRLLKHFFLTYSFQEQLFVAVGLFFTESSASFNNGKRSNEKTNFHCLKHVGFTWFYWVIYNAKIKMKNQLWNINLIFESFPHIPDSKNSVFELICYLNGEQYVLTASRLGGRRPQIVQEIMEMVTIAQQEWSCVLGLSYKRDQKVYRSWKNALKRIRSKSAKNSLWNCTAVLQ